MKAVTEEIFLSLPDEERWAIIGYGAPLRLSRLHKQLIVAENKIQEFQKKYNRSLSQLEQEGLVDTANYEIHEDYITWHHWTETAEKCRKDIASLQSIVHQGYLLTD